jgi:hypothetical protein
MVSVSLVVPIPISLQKILPVIVLQMVLWDPLEIVSYARKNAKPALILRTYAQFANQTIFFTRAVVLKIVQEAFSKIKKQRHVTVNDNK